MDRVTAQESAGGAENQEERVIDLVAACLARIDETREPPSQIIESFCAENPDCADALRKRLAYLERAGLSKGQTRPTDMRTLGRFELRGELGRGGMGVVYDAFDPRLERRVALKALGPRLVISDRARTRFNREIRAVAALNHPRIVPVYEVGEENGIPWYTMELIEGRTLAQVIHALKDLELRTDELSTSHLNQATFFERTETDTGLLHDSDSTSYLSSKDPESTDQPSLPKAWGKTYVETVCRMVHDVADALDHAHANGVVHRDVKPSNVLVDARGRALLFDFGLARIEDDEALTMTGDFAGTPFYVAPEQISGKRDIDHRADVYSLGVTLFELLTLQRPFTGRNSQIVFRQILAKDPPLLRRINRLVPRDLETICLTALEKDPARRYSSAGELAADLRRFLEFRPIQARPAGLSTRAIRWAKRKPASATAAALAMLIVLAVPIAVGVWNVVLAAEADRTARQAEKANTINLFLLDLLGTAHPAELGIDGTIREAIELAAGRVESDLTDPEVKAGILATIGSTYLAVAEPASAEPLLREALVLRRATLSPESPELLRSLDDLGRCRQEQGDLTEAGALFAEALEFAGAEDDATAEARFLILRHLALLRSEEGRFPEARRLAADAFELAHDLHGANSAEVAASMLDLADVLEREGNANGAADPAALATPETLYTDALARLIEAVGPNHPDTQACRERLAGLLMSRREIERSVELFAENVESLATRLSPRHALVARQRMRLALAIHLAGRNDEALVEARAAHEVQIDVLPAGHTDIASGEIVLAQILLDARLPEEASRLLEDSAQIRRNRGLIGPTADSLQRLARAYYDQVRLEEAIDAGKEALDLYAQMETPEEEFVAGVSRVVGLASMGLGRWDEAREHLSAAAEAFIRLRGADAPATIIYVQDLANVLFVQKRWGEAAEAYRLTLDSRRSRGAADQFEAVGAYTNLAIAEARLGNGDAALAAAREATAIHGRVGQGRSRHTARARLVEGRVLYARGDVELALEPLRRGVTELLELGDTGYREMFDGARLYGRALVELGRYDDAEVRLAEALDSASALLGAHHPDVRAIAGEMRALYQRMGDTEEVARLAGVEELSLKLRDAGLPESLEDEAELPLLFGPD